FHADFVSGHIDLAEKTGAKIVYGPKAEAEYEIYVGQDGETFPLGDVSFELLHTPGHTLESSCLLLKDKNGKDHAVFTGDTLFVGDVGRPDLAVSSEVSREDLASLLYDSLRQKLMKLNDEVIVYPGHGPGSACGKSIGNETQSTIGEQKQSNYALRDISKEQFIQELNEGLMPPPKYFFKDAVINRKGYESYDTIMEKNVTPLTAEETKKQKESGALVLDTRHHQTFNDGFIPGSLNIGLDGGFAVWVGTLVEDIEQPIVIVVEKGREQEAVKRLSRVGYDNVIGYLDGGVQTWKENIGPLDSITSISPEDLENTYKNDPEINILDVRKPGEYSNGHISNANSFPLDYIRENINELDKNKKYYLHCKAGYRSMAAGSLLKANGFQNIIDIGGGFDAIKKTGIKVTEPELA
ncbi:MAG: rhodanese-like domain-containing protein, partial [Flavobacteriales bacterium]